MLWSFMWKFFMAEISGIDLILGVSVGLKVVLPQSR